MSNIKIYVEGGGNSNNLHARCREGFKKLLENSGLKGRVPRIVACGSRNEAFDSFKTAQEKENLQYVALLVDSEDPVKDIEQTWKHLKDRDRWECPQDATDDQVFLMTTCMETWIITDRTALGKIYRNCLQTSALPSIVKNVIEQRSRQEIQDALIRATQKCTNAYAKNKHSFQALANVDPNTLQQHLPSFARMIRVLDQRLPE